jgi:predicted nucleic acid-binding Zn ribbon protein
MHCQEKKKTGKEKINRVNIAFKGFNFYRDTMLDSPELAYGKRLDSKFILHLI